MVALLTDSNHLVCGNVIKNIVSIMKILTPKSRKKPEEETKGDLMPTLKKRKSQNPKSANCSRKGSSLSVTGLTKEKLLKSILKAEEKTRNSTWRHHSEFFDQIQELMEFYSDSTIEKKIYPLIEYNLINGNR